MDRNNDARQKCHHMSALEIECHHMSALEIGMSSHVCGADEDLHGNPEVIVQLNQGSKHHRGKSVGRGRFHLSK